MPVKIKVVGSVAKSFSLACDVLEVEINPAVRELAEEGYDVVSLGQGTTHFFDSKRPLHYMSTKIVGTKPIGLVVE